MRTPIIRTTRDESVSETVVSAVAEATDVDPLALDPRLYEVIDPDALDRLFNEAQSEGRVGFTMAGCQVSVHADDHVVVVPLDATDTAGIEQTVSDRAD